MFFADKSKEIIPVDIFETEVYKFLCWIFENMKIFRYRGNSVFKEGTYKHVTIVSFTN